jgi:hypothetical protein
MLPAIGDPFAVGLPAAYPATQALSPKLAVRQVTTVEELRCPAGLGLIIGTARAPIIAPALLVLGLAMAGLYALLASRPPQALPDGPNVTNGT